MTELQDDTERSLEAGWSRTCGWGALAIVLLWPVLAIALPETADASRNTALELGLVTSGSWAFCALSIWMVVGGRRLSPEQLAHKAAMNDPALTAETQLQFYVRRAVGRCFVPFGPALVSLTSAALCSLHGVDPAASSVQWALSYGLLGAAAGLGLLSVWVGLTGTPRALLPFWLRTGPARDGEPLDRGAGGPVGSDDPAGPVLLEKD